MKPRFFVWKIYFPRCSTTKKNEKMFRHSSSTTCGDRPACSMNAWDTVRVRQNFAVKFWKGRGILVVFDQSQLTYLSFLPKADRGESSGWSAVVWPAFAAFRKAAQSGLHCSVCMWLQQGSWEFNEHPFRHGKAYMAQKPQIACGSSKEVERAMSAPCAMAKTVWP